MERYIFTFWWLLFAKYKAGWRPAPGFVILRYKGKSWPWARTVSGKTYIVLRWREYGVVPESVATELMLYGAFDKVDISKLKKRFPF